MLQTPVQPHKLTMGDMQIGAFRKARRYWVKWSGRELARAFTLSAQDRSDVARCRGTDQLGFALQPSDSPPLVLLGRSGDQVLRIRARIVLRSLRIAAGDVDVGLRVERPED